MSSKRLRKIFLKHLSDFGKNPTPFGFAYDPTSVMSLGFLAFGLGEQHPTRKAKASRKEKQQEHNRIRRFRVE